MTSIAPGEASEPGVSKRGRTALAVAGLGALGIVFGDIGTSPLYTLKTAFDILGGDATPDRILGMLSLLLWTLFLITSIKYVIIAMSIDNEGEGGILALMSLLGVQLRHRPLIILAGLLGAALIYGDGAITPAISVLSALEGFEIAAPSLTHYVLPASVLILLLLFAVQPLGTSRIGAAFGPVMLLWFIAIGALGIWGISREPGVLVALNPLYGLRLLASNGMRGFAVLGGIFLCVTGAEALYADMGHFGKSPIRFAWSWIVFPCLVLNYAGQSAIALSGESDRQQRLLPAMPGAAAGSVDLLGDCGHYHRQPVDHHRLVLHDPAGDPAWLAAAPAYQTDIGAGLWPDLCWRRQLAVDDSHHRADAAVPKVR